MLRPVQALLIFLIAFVARAQEYVPGEVLVRLKNDPGGSATFMGKAASAKAMKLEESFDRMNMHRFGLRKGQTVEQAVAELKQDPEVLYAEPNYIFRKIEESAGTHQSFSEGDVRAAAVTSSSMVSTSLDVGFERIWGITSAPPVKPVVAVLDTGLDLQHRVFRETGAIWVNSSEIPGNGMDDDGNGYIDDVHGWNFVDNSPVMLDDDGHGTHVAGLILAVDQNIFAGTLRPSKVKIMPLKFLNRSGVGTAADAVRAIQYAVDNGAVILNNSWGSSNYSEALHEAMTNAYRWGALTVASAGNSSSDNDAKPVYPAGFPIPSMISVAAVSDYDRLASFSNFGANSVHIAAPGVMVLSTVPGDRYATASGTSMSAPFVSGTAAYAKIESPNMLGYQIKTILLEQAVRSSYLGGKVQNSARLDAWKSVTFARTAAVQSTQPPYSTAGTREPAAAPTKRGGGCEGIGTMSNDMGPGNAIAVVLLILAQLAGLLYLRRRGGFKKPAKPAE